MWLHNTDVHTLCIMCVLHVYVYVCMHTCVCVCVCVCVCSVTFMNLHSITYTTFSIHSFSCLKASGHLVNHLCTINPSTLNCLNNMVPLSLAPIYTLLWLCTQMNTSTNINTIYTKWTNYNTQLHMRLATYVAVD